MGRKFVHSPLKVTESDFDKWAKPTKKYTFCQSYEGVPVQRIVINSNDAQGKLDLIRHYLMAISDFGLPLRRKVCAPHCNRECAKKIGMRPAIDNFNTFLKLTDFESVLWSVCLSQIGPT